MPADPSPARWTAVRAAAEAALELPPDERAGYLSGACGDDAALRAEVEQLVRACEDAAGSDDFLREPAAAFASPMLDRALANRDDEAGGIPDSLRAALDADGYTVERELARGDSAMPPASSSSPPSVVATRSSIGDANAAAGSRRKSSAPAALSQARTRRSTSARSSASSPQAPAR